MAAFDTTRPSVDFSAGFVSRFINNAVASFNTWNDARITRKSLLQLTERELADIGLTVSDIDAVAARRINS